MVNSQIGIPTQSPIVVDQNDKYYRIGEPNCPPGYKKQRFGLCEKCPVDTYSDRRINSTICFKCPTGFDTKGLDGSSQCTATIIQENCTNPQDTDLLIIKSEINNYKYNGTTVDCFSICERVNWTNFSNRQIQISSLASSFHSQSHTTWDESVWVGLFFGAILLFIVILAMVSFFYTRKTGYHHHHNHQTKTNVHNANK
jgi:hypothetical protein